MENANSRFDPSQGIDQLGSLLTGIYDQYENWAKSKGLNYTVFAILYFVYYREHCTQSDICAFWGFAKQTVSTQCNELLDKGILSIVQPRLRPPVRRTRPRCRNRRLPITGRRIGAETGGRYGKILRCLNRRFDRVGQG